MYSNSQRNIQYPLQLIQRSPQSSHSYSIVIKGTLEGLIAVLVLRIPELYNAVYHYLSAEEVTYRNVTNEALATPSNQGLSSENFYSEINIFKVILIYCILRFIEYIVRRTVLHLTKRKRFNRILRRKEGSSDENR